MAREPHILLAGLGLLAGAFVGVLSIKLLSPRPPAGAGVDIHDTVAIATMAELVEPPALSIAAAASAAMPDDRVADVVPVESRPRDAEAITSEPAVTATADRYSVRASSFSTAALDSPPVPAAVEPAFEPAPPPRDPFAHAGGFVSPPALMEEPQLLDSTAVAIAGPLPRSDSEERSATAAAAYVPAATGQAPRHEVTHAVAAAGDSWWSLAERMYGDGRYYRALFAWNRAVNPRVSLVPGTPLELPPLSKLAVAWPALVP